jgi:hypothetical protein
MEDCLACKKRKLWAYRTFLLYKWAIALPKGNNTGKILNFNSKTIIRWFVFRHFLGFAANYWFKEAIKEGAKEYDNRAASTSTHSSTSTKNTKVS